MSVRLPSPQSLPSSLANPGLLQTILALKVGEAECRRWWGRGMFGFEGSSVLLGPFTCAGKNSRCDHRAREKSYP